MMRLLCNGVYLDLYDDAGLQFTHDNPLFSFDRLSCERTTSFKLPCTPTNDSVLSLARIPAYNGVGMRRKFSTQMQAGTVVKNGYLYVADFDGKDYNAIFVTGEFIGLQEIRDLGNLPELLEGYYMSTYAILGETPQTPSYVINSIWANANYKHEDGLIVHPSMRLSRLYNDIVTKFGLNAQSLPASVADVRIIPSLMRNFEKDLEFKSTVTDNTQPKTTEPTTDYNTIGIPAYEFIGSEACIVDTVIMSINEGQPNRFYKVRQFKAKTDFTLYCPADWPSTRYIVDLTGTHQESGQPFYGGRYFTHGTIFDTTTQITPHGTALAGRSVNFNRGDVFMFVDSRDYNYFRVQDPMTGDWMYNLGWQFAAIGITFNYSLHIFIEAKNANYVCMNPHIPNISFTEFLKIIAAMSGTVLNYENNQLTFDTLNTSDFTEYWIDGKIITKNEVKRTFADYAQRNYIRYANYEEYGANAQDVAEIDNENIEQEKILQDIAFSNGVRWLGLNWLFVREYGEHDLVGNTVSGALVLGWCDCAVNATVKLLCQQSTQIKIKARLFLLEYMNIKSNTLICFEGSKYVWTNRSWQKDEATFTLAKIAW